jgi:Putative bacterial sensory transduction regulator
MSASDDALLLIDRWLAVQREENPVIADIERGDVEGADLARWYVRMRGEEKLVTTVWFTLRERTLHFETYVMPAPEENIPEFYEYLLRANQRLYVMRFAIGVEDAVYLVGQLPLKAIDEDELDRLLGAAYAHSEECFPTGMRIGYASRFRR